MESQPQNPDFQNNPMYIANHNFALLIHNLKCWFQCLICIHVSSKLAAKKLKFYKARLIFYNNLPEYFSFIESQPQNAH